MADPKAPGAGDEEVKPVEEGTVDKKKPAAGDEKKEKLLPSVLLPRVEEAYDAIYKAREHGRNDLQELSNVLDTIKRKLTAQEAGDGPGAKKDDDERFFPKAESKREELDSVLDEIHRALQSPQPPESEQPDVVQKTKKMLSAAAACNPFKLLSSSSQQKSRQQGEGGGGGGQEEEDHGEAASPKLLVRLAQQVLEPEQYYEWTTSYVDEERIYGWGEEAEKVAKALLATEPEELGFRAVAITGIHGSGKTTLAQKVFVHELAKDHFPIRLWVCIGPPDKEDKFNFLYRMLDNLGHDTTWIEDVVVDGAEVVHKQREATLSQEDKDELGRNAAAMVADKDQKTLDAVKEETERNYKQLLKKKVDDENEPRVRAAKIGVLLYILHSTLAKTAYLIVFDDIRVYGDDGWYSNLTLLPPQQPDKEWHERLAYGLPKTGKHRSAVLVTCRKEDDARTMVRAGRVFRPPKLDKENGWKVFEREYKKAKEDYNAKKNKDGDGKKDLADDDDKLFKYLEGMKDEIVEKCLGLPVAITEAAKGYACSDLQPLMASPDGAKPASAENKMVETSNKGMQTEDPSKLEATADDNESPE